MLIYIFIIFMERTQKFNDVQNFVFKLIKLNKYLLSIINISILNV